jgi:predicted HAD superfamily Cof-like phosphohydrolase
MDTVPEHDPMACRPFLSVLKFHAMYGMPIGDTPHLLEPQREKLRLDLIDEELKELKTACLQQDLTEAADALGDLIYVVNGMAIEMGINLDCIVDVIQTSNETKLGEDGKPIYREDGKVLKGPNYEKPKIREELIEQGWQPDEPTNL